jgi:hypothetical protein
VLVAVKTLGCSNWLQQMGSLTRSLQSKLRRAPRDCRVASSFSRGLLPPLSLSQASLAPLGWLRLPPPGPTATSQQTQTLTWGRCCHRRHRRAMWQRPCCHIAPTRLASGCVPSSSPPSSAHPTVRSRNSYPIRALYIIYYSVSSF